MNERERAGTLPAAIRVGIVLLPIALSLLAYALAPRYFEPMFATPPDWFGIPVGEVFLGIAVGWGLLGGLLVARTAAPYAVAICFAVFTLPACTAIIFGPAIILILQNLG